MGATTSLAIAKDAGEVEPEREELASRAMAAVAGAKGPLGVF
jgi:hypothetical protein